MISRQPLCGIKSNARRVPSALMAVSILMLSACESSAPPTATASGAPAEARQSYQQTTFALSTDTVRTAAQRAEFVAFVRPGVTTRAEIEARYGKPTYIREVGPNGQIERRWVAGMLTNKDVKVTYAENSVNPVAVFASNREGASTGAPTGGATTVAAKAPTAEPAQRSAGSARSGGVMPEQLTEAFVREMQRFADSRRSQDRVVARYGPPTHRSRSGNFLIGVVEVLTYGWHKNTPPNGASSNSPKAYVQLQYFDNDLNRTEGEWIESDGSLERFGIQ